MGWEQLKHILDENKRIAEDELQKPITVCPDCAWPLIKQNSKGEMACSVCGWKGYVK